MANLGNIVRPCLKQTNQKGHVFGEACVWGNQWRGWGQGKRRSPKTRPQLSKRLIPPTCDALTRFSVVKSARGCFVLFPELYYDRGNHHEFVSLVKDLARPGEITQSQAFDFEFTHVEKPYESYTGQNVKLR